MVLNYVIYKNARLISHVIYEKLDKNVKKIHQIYLIVFVFIFCKIMLRLQQPSSSSPSSSSSQPVLPRLLL